MDWLENVSKPDIWSAHRYIVKPVVDGGLSAILEAIPGGDNNTQNGQEIEFETEICSQTLWTGRGGMWSKSNSLKQRTLSL